MKTLSTSEPVARKEHSCSYCHGVIKIGEKYERSTNVAFGDLYEWKNHVSCQKIAQQLDMWDYADEGVTAEIFYEYITEEYATLNRNKDDVDDIDFQDQLHFVKKHYNIS